MAKQAGELDQLAGIVAQVAEREVWRSVCAETAIRLRRARRARLVMTAWMVRTGIAVSRLLTNSAASWPGDWRRSRCCLSARRPVAFSGTSRALRPLP